MADCILETKNLTKKYRGRAVVDDLNIKINKGDIYGFVGRNGAGKTTAMKMIAGIINPTSGSVTLFGSDNLNEGRKKIGITIENPSFYPHFSARQNIEAQRILKGVKDKKVTDELLELVGLKNVGKKKAKKFSLGMKQRLAIAIALIGDPEFLILDEPINGLDPQGIREVRELILKINREAGVTVLISSHILTEMTKIATRYCIIEQGKLVEELTNEELNNRLKSYLRFVVSDIERACSVLKENFDIKQIDVKDNSVCVYDNLSDYAKMNEVMEQNGITVESFSKNEGDPEDYFIQLMGGMKRDV